MVDYFNVKYELATFSTESRKALEPLQFLECKYRNSESESWLPVKHLNFKFISSAGTISETQISRRDSSQFFQSDETQENTKRDHVILGQMNQEQLSLVGF